jgi:lipoprotein
MKRKNKIMVGVFGALVMGAALSGCKHTQQGAKVESTADESTRSSVEESTKSTESNGAESTESKANGTNTTNTSNSEQTTATTVAESSSVSSTEKNSDEKNEAYAEVLKSLIAAHGDLSEKTFGDDGSGEGYKISYASGVCYSALIDFDGDGRDELMVVYGVPHQDATDDYQMEVYSDTGKGAKKLYTGPAGTTAESTGDTLEFSKKGKNTYYLLGYINEEEVSYTYYGMENGKFKKLKKFTDEDEGKKWGGETYLQVPLLAWERKQVPEDHEAFVKIMDTLKEATQKTKTSLGI